jgi:hypothetical protein
MLVESTFIPKTLTTFLTSVWQFSSMSPYVLNQIVPASTIVTRMKSIYLELESLKLRIVGRSINTRIFFHIHCTVEILVGGPFADVD